jgi:radical SAM superfamily enzyme YgiQ (UPF0313 family)
MPSPSASTGTTPHADEGRLDGLRVLLVFPTFLSPEMASYEDNGRFLGVVPPLSLLYVAAVLERAGAVVEVLDCPALGIECDEAVSRGQVFAPDYVGFTLTTVDWASSLRWIQAFDAQIGAPVIVGGIHMECYPAETLTHSAIALGFAGQADVGLVEILEAHAAGRAIDSLPGAIVRTDTGVAVVPGPKGPKTDAGLPFPARHKIDNHRYFTIVSEKRHFTAAMSNFGCPFGCSFCILRASPVRQRSVQSVVDEMVHCYYDHDIREIDFFDPVFTLRRDRALAICAALEAKRLPGLVWSIRARPDTIDEGLLDALWAAGCRRIFYGIESGSHAVRARVNKRMLTNEKLVEVLEATSRRGFEVLAFTMIGNPGDTRETIRETRQFLRNSPVDLIQVASLFPLPNTPIYEEIVKLTGKDSWREHILHGTSIHPITRLDTDLDDAEIRRLVTRIYVGFYFRPSFARYALRRLRNPAQGRHGISAAMGIADTYVREHLKRRGA